jgi:quercetin dioxygenase-like cupin family protein
MMKQLAISAALISAVAASPAGAQGIELFTNGSGPTGKGPPETFTGAVMVDPLMGARPPLTRVGAGHVTFEPGPRSGWHTHPAGQILIVTSGTGWVQDWGGEKREIKPGDVVWIPPGVKHWHGATATNAMGHIAIQETVDGRNVDWMEKVTDEQYGVRR